MACHTDTVHGSGWSSRCSRCHAAGVAIDVRRPRSRWAHRMLRPVRRCLLNPTVSLGSLASSQPTLKSRVALVVVDAEVAVGIHREHASQVRLAETSATDLLQHVSLARLTGTPRQHPTP
eukprot:10739172-Heterocapsa_arctica.AAC.1